MATLTDQAGRLGGNLRRHREANGLTRSALAHLSNTSEATIARAELYNANPRLNTVAAWATALGCQLTDLFADEAPEVAAR